MAWFLRLASIFHFVGELLHITGRPQHRWSDHTKPILRAKACANDNLVNEADGGRGTSTEVKTVASLKGLRSGATLWGLRKSMMVLHRSSRDFADAPSYHLGPGRQDHASLPRLPGLKRCCPNAYGARYSSLRTLAPNGEARQEFNPLWSFSFLEGASDGESGTKAV